jgi:hypothetical protein
MSRAFDQPTPAFLRFLLHRGGGLSLAMPEIVEFGAAHLALSLDLNLGNSGRIYREDPLDAFTVADSPNREVGIDAGSFATDDNAAVDLDALLVALDDPRVNLHRVAHAKRRNVLLELFALNFFDDAHDPWKSGTGETSATHARWQVWIYATSVTRPVSRL